MPRKLSPREELELEIARIREDNWRRDATHEAEGDQVRDAERDRLAREEARRQAEAKMRQEEEAEMQRQEWADHEEAMKLEYGE